MSDARPPPLPPSLPKTPRFSRGVTAIGGVLILAGLVAASTLSGDPLAALDDPEGAVVRLYERDLAVEEADRDTPLSRAFDEGGETAAEAERAWRETITWLAREGGDGEAADRLRTHLIVLLGEQGRFDEAAPELMRLPSSALSEAPEFVEAVRAAYGGAEEELAALPDTLPPDGWARRHLAARLQGTPPDGEPAYGAADAAIWTAWVALLLVGLLLAALFLFVPRRRPSVASGRIPGPWPPGDGIAVLVRGPLLGLAILVVVSASAYVVSDAAGEAVFLWASLLLFLPCVFLVVRFLLRPYGLRLPQAFGLTASPGRLAWLLLAGVATLAIDQMGGLGIAHACRAAGLEGHWSEGVAEEMFFGSTTSALLSGLDAALWAPLFEEILFRGVLYATLRRRWRPLPAALASAVIFSAVHLYSWPGFFVILWSGFVWAWVYERTRSLWPSIVAHALHNLVLVVHVFAVYR